jgi:hypothetical protein
LPELPPWFDYLFISVFRSFPPSSGPWNFDSRQLDEMNTCKVKMTIIPGMDSKEFPPCASTAGYPLERSHASPAPSPGGWLEGFLGL